MAWLVFVDAVLDCRFIRVSLWSVVLARVGATPLFGSMLGLAVGVCVGMLFVWLSLVVIGFRPVFS